MDVLTTVASMQSASRNLTLARRSIGLVPTMGFLHDGHLSLVRIARKHSDVVVVSIFVNPTQFGPGEDLDRYPRDFERDCRLCEDSGVDIIFAPPVDEMYVDDASVFVDEKFLATGLCGASRDGHFRGVLTVVAKLFNMVQPDIAVFGQKDAQQAALIKRMVRDLNFPVDVMIGPIVREADGLAMSSRNSYLSPEDRADALWLHRSLEMAERKLAGGAVESSAIIKDMRSLIAKAAPKIDVEYIEVVDGVTLKPLEVIRSGSLIALAARVGQTRLIDNIIFR